MTIRFLRFRTLRLSFEAKWSFLRLGASAACVSTKERSFSVLHICNSDNYFLEHDLRKWTTVWLMLRVLEVLRTLGTWVLGQRLLAVTRVGRSCGAAYSKYLRTPVFIIRVLESSKSRVYVLRYSYIDNFSLTYIFRKIAFSKPYIFHLLHIVLFYFCNCNCNFIWQIYVW